LQEDRTRTSKANIIPSKIDAVWVDIENDRCEPPKLPDLLDNKTTDRWIEKGPLQIVISDLDILKTSGNRHFSEEFSTRKLTNG
jgi:hypothetical protein